MEQPLDFSESCAWRSNEHCPVEPNAPGEPRPLMVRVDVGSTKVVACACNGRRRPGNAPEEAPVPTHGERRLSPPFHGCGPGFEQAGLDRWKALQPLLKNPLEGMAALGLSVLPMDVQDVILEALLTRRTVVVRVNLHHATAEASRMAVLGIRALGQATGILVSVVETTEVPPLASGGPEVSGTGGPVPLAAQPAPVLAPRRGESLSPMAGVACTRDPPPTQAPGDAAGHPCPEA